MQIRSLAIERCVATLLTGLPLFSYCQISLIKEFKGNDIVYAHELIIDSDNNILLVGNFSDEFKIENYEYTDGGGFILKLTSDGDLLSHILFTSTTGQIGVDNIKKDAAGNFYVTGSFSSSFKVNNQTYYKNGYSAFLAKFDSNLNTKWIKTYERLQFIEDFAVNSSGQIVIYSPFSRGEPVPDTNNAFAVLYNTDGTTLWSRIFSTSTHTAPIAVALDDIGNSYFTGYYSGPFSLDSKSIPLDGNRDIYLAKINPSGVCLLLKNFKRETGLLNTNFGEYGALEVDGNENIYIAGSYWTSIDLDQFTFYGDPQYGGMFVTKLDAGGNALWATTISDYSSALQIIPKNGQVYLSGTIGKKGFLTFFDDQPPIAINPVFYPFEFVDNALGGLGVNSYGNIYASGRLAGDEYSGFLLLYNVIDPGIGKGNPVISKNIYCQNINTIVLNTSALENSSAYQWELTYEGKITKIITSLPEITINLQELGIKGDFSIRVRGKNQYGTGAYSQSTVIHFDYLSTSSVFIPNVITPNNDSLNDFFVIDDALGTSSLAVYNRWGKQVYFNENYYNTWDGNELTSGIYYYMIKSKCLVEPIKGWVTILR